MRLLGHRHQGEDVPEGEPLAGEFVVIEEAIGRFAVYPADAAPVRRSGPGRQGAVPPLGWPAPNGRVENTMTMRF